ncbi:MAG: hypothetical protein FWD36_03265 [Treponema sp.]|nr:hypothetical protein [Treponema sp.]
MITTWKEFFDAVEKMRECQKIYSKDRSPISLRVAQKREAVVDECIKEKNAEWARKLQPELV